MVVGGVTSSEALVVLVAIICSCRYPFVIARLLDVVIPAVVSVQWAEKAAKANHKRRLKAKALADKEHARLHKLDKQRLKNGGNAAADDDDEGGGSGGLAVSLLATAADPSAVDLLSGAEEGDAEGYGNAAYEDEEEGDVGVGGEDEYFDDDEDDFGLDDEDGEDVRYSDRTLRSSESASSYGTGDDERGSGSSGDDSINDLDL